MRARTGPNALGAGRARLVRIAAVVAVLGSLVGISSAALAAGTQKGGAVRMFGTPKGSGGNFMFTGAIGDYGTTQRENANGSPNANGNYVRFNLKHGTFIANATGFFAALNKAKFAFNDATCSFSGGASGPASLSSGTGQYAGISGTLKVAGTFAQVGPRFKSGKHKGQCSPNGKPLIQFNAVTGSGTVSFS